ncbi:Macrophage killing protein with similarity to conjugation protein [compost metagenome]
MFKRNKRAAEAQDRQAEVLTEESAEVLELRVVQKSNSFLRGVLLASVAVNLVVGVGVWVLSGREPIPGDVYAMDRDGGRVKLIAFSGTGNSTARLMNFTSENASEVLTFNFLNSDEKIESLKNRFTSRGFRQYKAALEQARVQNYLEANQEVWDTAVNETPVIANEAQFQGGDSRKWLMQVGVLTKRLPKSKSITYESRRVSLEVVQVSGSNFLIDNVGWEKI